jgi:hypothetical protein
MKNNYFIESLTQNKSHIDQKETAGHQMSDCDPDDNCYPGDHDCDPAETCGPGYCTPDDSRPRPDQEPHIHSKNSFWVEKNTSKEETNNLVVNDVKNNNHGEECSPSECHPEFIEGECDPYDDEPCDPDQDDDQRHEHSNLKPMNVALQR